MSTHAAQEYCEDCIRKERCEYRPAAGKLIRCLDKQTSERPSTAEAKVSV